MYTLVLLLCIASGPGHTACHAAYQHNLASVAQCSAVRGAVMRWADASHGRKVVAFSACRLEGKSA